MAQRSISRSLISSLVLVNAAVISSSSQGFTNWTVIDKVCPDVSVTGWGKYESTFDTLDSCWDFASSKNASMFTWNFYQKTKECWGFSADHPEWKMKSDPHCDSGCIASEVTGCALPPLPPNFPKWIGPVPSISINSSAGLPLVSNAQHITVYKSIVDKDDSKNPFGVYNHGPMITKYMSKYYISWYNAPIGEDVNKRSVFATSDDGVKWTKPTVLFPTLTQTDHGTTIDGEENGPWTILGTNSTNPGRLYSQSGSQDAGEHHEGIISVMRRVGINGNATAMGPQFWLNKTVPWYCQNISVPECDWPTYLEMDDVTRTDAEQLLASFVRTTVVYPDMQSTHGGLQVQTEKKSQTNGAMEYNERSLYKIPGSRDLVLLLRGKSHVLSVSMCKLPEVPVVEEDHTLFSCRSGVGDAFMNLVEVVTDFNNHSDPRVCNWTAPQLSTLPDAGSRTCAAQFPKGSGIPGIYLVGNQVDSGRDPVTLSLSADGVSFDRHWAVRAAIFNKTIDEDGSCPRFKGRAKCCGFQYPGAMIDVSRGVMIVSYSIGKEDIAITRFNLSEIENAPL